MKVILMNKNVAVLIAEYNEELICFEEMYEIINMDYAPLILKESYIENNDNLILLSVLSDWFKGRGIPILRDNLDLLLYRLNINTPEELLNKEFGLSLSDQYWIKPVDLNVYYDKVNYFENDYDYTDFMKASLSKRVIEL